jgi:hypothetical protein
MSHPRASGLTTDRLLAIVIGLAGIAGVVFSLDWIVRSILVAVAVALTVYAAWIHSARPIWRVISALVVIVLFVGFSWRPIWDDFQNKYPKQIRPPSLLTLFMTDIRLTESVTVTTPLRIGVEHVWCNTFYDFDANNKFAAIYMPRMQNAYNAAIALTRNYQKCWEVTDLLRLQWPTRPAITAHNLRDMPFSGRIYLYHMDIFNNQEKSKIELEFQNTGARSIIFRGLEYVDDTDNKIKLGQLKPPLKHYKETETPLAIVEDK